MREIVAGGGVDHRRISRQLRRWTGRAVARNGAIDQLGFDRRERFVIEAKPAHHARPEILDDHIGGGGESPDRVDGWRRLEIEDDALFPGIELAKAGAGAVPQWWPGAHHVALGRLHLDHLGAEIGQQARTMRSGDRGREIEYANAFKDTGHQEASHRVFRPSRVRTATRMSSVGCVAPHPNPPPHPRANERTAVQTVRRPSVRPVARGGEGMGGGLLSPGFGAKRAAGIKREGPTWRFGTHRREWRPIAAPAATAAMHIMRIRRMPARIPASS